MKILLSYSLTLIFLLNINQKIIAQEVNYIPGVPQIGSEGIIESTSEIMQREYLFGYHPPIIFELELTQPDRTNIPQNPESLPSATWPPNSGNNTGRNLLHENPQSIGLNFNGATGPTETGSFPPDVMCAAGTNQFLVFVNGKIRSFNKLTGIADGILEVSPNNFFNSVMTPPQQGEVTFTSDPNIRYDRLSQRWFLTILDVIYNTTTGYFSRPNRLLFAVSDGDVIGGTSDWTFYQFQADSNLTDYPSLGIDADALYIGTDQFTLTGYFVNTNAYVIRKISLLNGGPIVYTKFPGLIVSGSGPLAPRGVDNPDPINTGAFATGYFIGVDFNSYGKLALRRILDPGGTPSISENISLTVNTTSNPFSVPHLGNTGGTNGYLDALDERLFTATIRNGHLWTSHNINVNENGIATTGRNRDAIRWYEIADLNTAPGVLQSGTIFDNIETNPRYYWIPSMSVSGQEHAAIGFSTSGSMEYVNTGITGRLNNDTLGVMYTPLLYTSSSTSYNPPSDPGYYGARRWGDYSLTCVDPDDDMTMWTIQEYCNGTNTYGVRIAQVLAPPPAVPVSCDPPAVAPNLSSVDIIVNGNCINGSGFFDPGPDSGGPGFSNHIIAVVGGGIIINSLTYYSPDKILINLSTNSVPDGFYDVSITNPDGQSKTGAGIIQVDHLLPVELKSFTAENKNNNVLLKWRTETETNNYGFEVNRKDKNGISSEVLFKKIAFITGSGTTSIPHDYSYIDKIPEPDKYTYRLKQIDYDGSYEYSNEVQVDVSVALKFSLEQNYPNPFNPTTTINYQLPITNIVSLKVYNALGEEVAALVNEEKPAGTYEVKFDAFNLSTGIYFYKLTSGDYDEVKKMLLLK